jgi:2,4-dienoyl-CoA reductase (NADPH2)
VHRYDCRFVIQLIYGGGQADIRGIENRPYVALGPSGKTERFTGIPLRAMTEAEIADTVALFAEGAARAREAGADGIELQGANGYLINQFLSSAINDRKDGYGGSLEHRARFLLDVVRAVREKVGDDYFLCVKLSARDSHNAGTLPLTFKRGNTIEDTIQVAQWLERAGVDAVHISTGSGFPHPHNPAGPMNWTYALAVYQSMLASGRYTWRNYLLLRYRALRWIPSLMWSRTQTFVRKGEAIPELVEGLGAADAHRIRDAVSIPVISTGGWQTASRISQALENGDCDAVSIARPLLANPELPQLFRAGQDGPAPGKRCTYCNKCLINVLEHPIGCYEVSRFAEHGEQAWDRMIDEVMAYYEDEVPGAAGA